MYIKRIAVVGNGLMGKGISHMFTLYGYNVDLFGRRNDVQCNFSNYIDDEVEKSRVTSEQREGIFRNIRFYNINIQPERLSDSELIIETVKEDIQTKKEIISLINKHIDNKIFVASNTSSYSITRLAEFSSYPENFLGMHFFSPVPSMKLVEVVKGKKTSKTAIGIIGDLLNVIDKLPIQVKDSPGFVLNRGILLLINEAVHILNENIANSVEDIDNIFIYGMGLKVGPLRLADLIGIDVIYACLTNLYEDFSSDKYKPCNLLKQMVAEDKLGQKTGVGFYRFI